MRAFLRRWWPFFRPRTPAPPPEPARPWNPELFIYVKIPEGIGPLVRGDKYEDPLERRLQAEEAGTVSGGGQLLGRPDADGKRLIEYCGVDVDATNVQRALTVIRDELPKCGAPMGTEIHYTSNGVALQDELRSSGWELGRARSVRHPGFNC